MTEIFLSFLFFILLKNKIDVKIKIFRSFDFYLF